MKRKIFAFICSAFILAGCGSMSQVGTSSSYSRFQDGAYTAQTDQAANRAAIEANRNKPLKFVPKSLKSLTNPIDTTFLKGYNKGYDDGFYDGTCTPWVRAGVGFAFGVFNCWYWDNWRWDPWYYGPRWVYWDPWYWDPWYRPFGPGWGPYGPWRPWGPGWGPYGPYGPWRPWGPYYPGYVVRTTAASSHSAAVGRHGYSGYGTRGAVDGGNTWGRTTGSGSGYKETGGRGTYGPASVRYGTSSNRSTPASGNSQYRSSGTPSRGTTTGAQRATGGTNSWNQSTSSYRSTPSSSSYSTPSRSTGASYGGGSMRSGGASYGGGGGAMRSTGGGGGGRR